MSRTVDDLVCFGLPARTTYHLCTERQIFSFKVFRAIIVSTHIVDNLFLIQGNIGTNRKLFQSGAATIQ
jgi:hypothetical protein